MFQLLVAALFVVSVSCLEKRNLVSDDDVQTILQGHNKYRQNHGANPLVWNNELATYANEWSKKCIVNHSASTHGENIAGRTSSWTQTVDVWYEEGAKYDFAHPGFSAYTGHFTQIVWKNTKNIGCAVTYCDSIKGNLYVCEYEPRGNVLYGAGDPVIYFKSNVTQ